MASAAAGIQLPLLILHKNLRCGKKRGGIGFPFIIPYLTSYLSPLRQSAGVFPAHKAYPNGFCAGLGWVASLSRRFNDFQNARIQVQMTMNPNLILVTSDDVRAAESIRRCLVTIWANLEAKPINGHSTALNYPGQTGTRREYSPPPVLRPN